MTTELAESHTAVVASGSDRGDGLPVVTRIVSLAHVPTAAIMRLDYEAAALLALEGPSIGTPLSLQRDGDTLVVVHAARHAPTLADRLTAGPLAIAEAVAVGRALLEALAEAHERGLLHRDVCPANIHCATVPVVSGFGVPRAFAFDAADPTSAAYLSPEQAGLIERDVDARSDLYAAGVVLYACLTGHAPFDGQTLGEVLRAHLGGDPSDLRARRPEVPRVFATVVERLMRRDPRERYQSARAAAADLRALAAALDAGDDDPALVAGTHDARSTLVEPAFVGRRHELAALDLALDRAAHGRGGIIAIESESGGGKTRLIEELVARAARRGAWCLRGRGAELEAQRPLAALTGVVRQASAAAHDDALLAGRMRTRIGPHAEALRAALPEWTLDAGPEPHALGPEAFGETRSMPALVAFLAALGGPERPAVVVLDDAQWADDLTLKLIQAWFAATLGPERHTLLVIAYRGDEVGPDHGLRSVDPTLLLAPLAGAELRALLESMAGPLPREAVDAVLTISAGNPFVASTTLEGLVEGGALVPARVGWRFEPRAMSDAGASRRAATVLAQRFDVLSQSAQRFLTAGAVFGRSFDLADATALSGLSNAAALGALDEARRRRLVWAAGPDGSVSFLHDRLRTAILGRLTLDARRSLHHTAAEHLRINDGSAFAIAYHFDAAEEPERALPFALTAAEEARRRYAFGVAEGQYRIAAKGAARADPAALPRIAEALGQLLLVRGSPEAQQQLEAARSAANDDVARARIDDLLGELATKRDHADAAVPLRRGLKLLGYRVPHNIVGFALALIWQILAQLAHRVVPRWFVGRGAPRDAEVELLAARLHYHLAYVLWFRRGPLPTLWAVLRSLNIAERHPPGIELADALAGVGVPLSSLSVSTRIGDRYLERGIAIARERGDIWAEGRAIDLHAFVLAMKGRYREALPRGREAVALLRRSGDVWHTANVTATIACSQFRTGDLRGAAETARRLNASATQAAEEASSSALSLWARAAGGRVPRETTHVGLLEDRVLAGRIAPHGQIARRQAEAVRLMAEGSPGAAAELLAGAVAIARAARLRQEIEAVTPCWLATALREQLALVPLHDAATRERLMRELRRTIRLALRWVRGYPGNRPHALREAALLASIEGRPRRARRLLARSLAAADLIHGPFEHAVTRLWRGKLAGPDGEADVTQAQADLLAMGADFAVDGRLAAPALPRAGTSASLADRLATLLQVGRAIVSTFSREAIVTALEEAASTLLRGERVVVFDQHAEGASGAVRRAIAMGEPLIDDSDEARSALAMPVLVRGEVQLCLWIVHDKIDALFGDEDLRLARFVATLAGAALENADAANDLAHANVELVQQRQEIRRLGVAVVASQEDERKRLSRALHDGAGQVLTLLAIELDRDTDRETDLTRAKRLRERSTMVHGLLIDLRRLSHDLRPAALDQLGLGPALRELAAAFRCELETHIAVSDEAHAAPEVAVHLFRITQAALANVVRHARARRVSLRFEEIAAELVLTIEDDGIGFDVSSATAGMGLVGIRERVAWLGGHCIFDSILGRGTRVEVHVPVAGRC